MPIYEAGELTIEEITLSPTNQGEPATYRFSLYAPVEIWSTDRIIIWFPDSFDPSLTTTEDAIECWGEPNEFVGGLLNC